MNPQLGENIGMAARAMANFGLFDLQLEARRVGRDTVWKMAVELDVPGVAGGEEAGGEGELGTNKFNEPITLVKLLYDFSPV